MRTKSGARVGRIRDVPPPNRKLLLRMVIRGLARNKAGCGTDRSWGHPRKSAIKPQESEIRRQIAPRKRYFLLMGHYQSGDESGSGGKEDKASDHACIVKGVCRYRRSRSLKVQGSRTFYELTFWLNLFRCKYTQWWLLLLANFENRLDDDKSRWQLPVEEVDCKIN